MSHQNFNINYSAVMLPYTHDHQIYIQTKIFYVLPVDKVFLWASVMNGKQQELLFIALFH